MPDADPNLRPSLLAALAALAALSVGMAALDGPFIFDDVPLILGNHYVHGFEHWRRWLTEALWSTNFDVSVEHRSFWRPLVVASYALDWWWGAQSPFSFHVTNFVIHAGNTCVLFYLLRGWVRGSWPALFGALAFALHPVQTECVAWISGRTDSLAALGLLAATLGVRVTRRHVLPGLALQAVGLCVAVASKEMAVVLPVLVALEIWSERPGALDRARALEILKRTAPYLGFALAFALVHRGLDAGNSRGGPVGAWQRVPFVFEAFGRYATLVALPHDLTLGRALLRHVDGVIQPHRGYAVLGAAVLGALGSGAYRWRAHNPRLALGLGAWVALTLPVSGVVWLGYAVLVSPRFLYIPMIAVALLVSALAASAAGGRPLARAGIAALLASWACVSALRARDFSSSDLFWRRELTQNPGYAPAHEYFISRELQAARPRAALELALRALSLHERAQAAEGEQRATLILKCAAALLALTPDVDQTTLRAIEEFARGAIAGAPARLSVPELGVDILLEREARSRAALAREHRTLRVMVAEAAQRRGDDEAAVREMGLALNGCDDCWTLLSTGALIFARAGQLERALTLARRAQAHAASDSLGGLVSMIENAAAWHRRRVASPSPVLEAAFHSSLGAFGRAYVAAQPAFHDPPRDPEAVLRLAQLAFRAGDVEASRRLLASIFSAPTVQASLERFATNVSWQDRPRNEEEWFPAEPG